MAWLSKSLNSSLGKKLLMAITGLFLVSFLIVHCGLNATIFLNDGGVTFNEGAEFMAKNPIIRTMEIVLFGGLLLHILDGLRLWMDNKKKRPVAYAVVDGAANSKWYSRSMGLLGTLLLLFLIIHLKHFWYFSRLTDNLTEEHTLYNEMQAVFTSPVVVIIYVLGCISLGYHLLHGFQSAFQSLGWNHPKYTPTIKCIGAAYAIIIAALFAAMPIALHFNLIH
ncbi:succinate dehydrogenase cytochrome b subunit [Aquirufa ecclesiirivi]|uniref:Succinate dehydrogenase cytochrome b subunit n=1 Tax=Aquirufa ecclesiirivi TaxID=2715124 RepID=A0ABT4JJ55_9BACT|nr:succinate dehydrogenase cytochrome b subunit [Aquirufa ecclesiirivi]MCZ2471292.1 succinate dehydrogenase cytochrome b subunit [Aquirufa ecclesiirivi]MCZ2476003.1 succinate dehydrogenase cytochrome b subunit [Aquirufa ecclesiirivi]MDF0692983.1 succinate dehydrogenase cytochrome b subunit [Aquirufa ecclesiirivi]NHC49797.1 succinate dehydrogenase cytochrome b subunit [Aquirufa ecclesiirivi]